MFDATNIANCLLAYDKVKASPLSTEKERNDAYNRLLRSIFDAVVRHGGSYRACSHEFYRNRQEGRSEEQFFLDILMRDGYTVSFDQTADGKTYKVDMKVSEVRYEELEDRDELLVEGYVEDTPEAAAAGFKAGQHVSLYAGQLDDLYPLILCVHGLHDDWEKLNAKIEAGEI